MLLSPVGHKTTLVDHFILSTEYLEVCHQAVPRNLIYVLAVTSGFLIESKQNESNQIQGQDPESALDLES
jgi:hypothetical protein